MNINVGSSHSTQATKMLSHREELSLPLKQPRISQRTPSAVNTYRTLRFFTLFTGRVSHSSFVSTDF
ncbi:hypothetical protein EG68_01520 [Paragonimus skrjabini miyazakii]|uniref:Uncharacterized protein n=1 Tax=Paragonimus skrjabini miyazakii TaxID=59628 RepID=A0A8S9Z6D0_9TREM|nr:hypothetical protein EG68_01520 [Paragonimus skrjabini miyazakii]